MSPYKIANNKAEQKQHNIIKICTNQTFSKKCIHVNGHLEKKLSMSQSSKYMQSVLKFVPDYIVLDILHDFYIFDLCQSEQ